MEIIDLLKQNLGENNVLENESMAKYTSFKTGGNADIFVKIDDVNKLNFLIKMANRNDLPLFVLGNGTNILVTDKGIRGIVAKIEICKFEIKEYKKDEENRKDKEYKKDKEYEEDNDYIYVTVGSGNKNGEISQKLLNLEIEGFEFASRNSRKHRRSNKNECWCTWKRNERHSI